MNTLYFEVIGSVVLAGVLGLASGWMAHRAKARRSLRRAVAYWQKRCEDLMPADGHDAESLQARVGSLDQLLGAETLRTRELETQLGAANSRLEKARGDAIRLNSQQAGIQERLQRIIREKDQELDNLARQVERAGGAGQVGARAAAEKALEKASENASKKGPERASLEAVQTSAASDEIEAYIDRLSDRGERISRAPHRPTVPGTAPAAAALADQPLRRAVSERPAAREAAESGAPTAAGPDAGRSTSATAGAAGGATGAATHQDDPEDEDDHLDDTLDATAVIDMELEHDVTATRRIDSDPLDATSQEPLLFDEDTIAFDEDTIAFDDATLARVRQRSHKA